MQERDIVSDCKLLKWSLNHFCPIAKLSEKFDVVPGSRRIIKTIFSGPFWPRNANPFSICFRLKDGLTRRWGEIPYSIVGNFFKEKKISNSSNGVMKSPHNNEIPSSKA